MVGCIALAAIGLLYVLPPGGFTLSWTHSVERTSWEEDYELRGGLVVISEARVVASGAGMEPMPGAVWSKGWWRYVPALAPQARVWLANSAEMAGYTVCSRGRCRPMNELLPGNHLVAIHGHACAVPDPD